ncbi:MAG: DUF885 domain-containing protein [Eubacteriales bacterium]
MNKKRLSLIVCLLILLLGFAFCIHFTSNDTIPSSSKSAVTTMSLDQLTHTLFLQEITNDTLTLHYMLSNPESYSIQDYCVKLPSYTLDNSSDSLALENALYLLHSMESHDFSNEDYYTYSVLSNYLSHQLNGQTFSDYFELLSPSQGIQSSYPILMAEYAFREKSDIDEYLTLLGQTNLYFDSLISLEQERAQKGFALTDYSLEKVILQCNTMITKQSLENDSHFLQTSFIQKCQPFIDGGILTPQEVTSYCEENNRILSTVVLPAYTDLGDALQLLKGSSSNQDGLHYLENGCDYYVWLLEKNTGSSRSIADIYELLQKDYAQNVTLLSSMLKEQAETPTFTEKNMSTFTLTSPLSMIDDLTERMSTDFPSYILEDTDSYPLLTIKDVDPSMEDYTSPAFYMVPPIDDVLSNTIYINQKNSPSGLELYTTLAHEGYPGHLYQTTYYHLYQDANDINPIRTIMNFGGYVEGYAIYVEFLAYDYASDLMTNSSSSSSYSDLYELLKLRRKTELGLLSILDVSIHYYGLQYDDIYTILSDYGLNNQEQIRSIYEYIVEEPTIYLKYYLGYLEILSLKEESQTLWGDTYSDYRFHEFLLNSGPADFENLKMRLLDSQ